MMVIGRIMILHVAAGDAAGVFFCDDAAVDDQVVKARIYCNKDDPAQDDSNQFDHLRSPCLLSIYTLSPKPF